MLSDEELSALAQLARAAAERAYAPYSRFRVGAAILLEDGAACTGCNVENASYGLSICAERTALFRAMADRGPHLRIVAVAIANLNSAPSPPCGACRQVLAEFALPDAVAVFPGETGESGPPMPFRELFPYGFKLERAR